MNAFLSLPASFSTPRQVLAPIVALENVAPRHFLLTLQAPSIASEARAGQFVHVLARDSGLPDPFLRRAFSLMAARPDQQEIDILFRVEGAGTAQIAKKRVGETLDIIGPLGRPFDIGVFHVKQQEDFEPLTPVLVGGGVGVPPLIFLGETLKAARLEPLMLLGARSVDEVLGTSRLNELQIETRIATDDGSAGQGGRVTELLETALQAQPRAVIYACGPWPMLRAVAALAARFSVACQVSLEENMPCGIGVCNGCVVAMKNTGGADEDGQKSSPLEGADYGRYQRICVKGPALWASEVDWEGN